jgi:hypothetical protein
MSSEARAEYDRAVELWRREDYPGAQTHANASLGLSQQAHDELGVARALSVRGWIAAHQRRFEDAERDVLSAIKILEDATSKPALGAILADDYLTAGDAAFASHLAV